MKIEDYIAIHHLQPWKKWLGVHHLHDGTPQVGCTTADNGENFPQTDELQIYANLKRTRFVIVNVTRNIFKIHLHELISCSTNWHDCDRDFLLQQPA
ncbi:MAG TPA: hypothetical protein VGO57_14105 [Verrucomicrobiae bacterium]|jgi:hypothetical protein